MKVKTFLSSLFLIVFIFCPSLTLAKDPLESYTSWIEADSNKIDQLISYLNTTKDEGENFLSALSAYKNFFTESKTIYQDHCDKIDKIYKESCQNAQEAVIKIISSLDNLAKGFNQSDETVYNSAIEELNVGVSKLEKAIALYNEAASSPDAGFLYILLFVIF